MSCKKIVAIPAGLFIVIAATVIVFVSIYDFNQLKPLTVRLVKEYTGRNLTIGGEIKFKLRLHAGLTIGDVRFQNAPWGSQSDMITVKRLDVHLGLFPLLSRHVQLKRLVFIEPNILIERNRQGAFNLAMDAPGRDQKSADPTPTGEDAGFRLSLGRIRIEKGRVTFRDATSPRPYALKIHEVEIYEEAFTDMLKVALKGDFNSRPLEIKGRVGNIHRVLSSQKPWQMDLACRLAETTLGLKGSVRDMVALKGLDGTVTVRGPSLQGLIGFFDSAPFPPIGKFDLRFRVTDPAPGLFRVDDLQATSEGIDLQGKGHVKWGGKRPDLALDLNARNLDIRPVMAVLSRPHAPGGESRKKDDTVQIKKDKVFSKTPFALGHLRAADIRFDLKADTFITRGLAAENLHMKGGLSNGRLTVHTFKAGAGKAGTLDGRIDLRTKGRHLTLTTRFKVDRADLEAVYRIMGKKSPAAGLLDLHLELAGGGRSAAELMAGLDGMIEVTMGEGRLNVTGIGFLGGDLTNGIRDTLDPLKKKRDFTPVNCFVGRCDIRNGLATLSALVLSTPETTLLGEGRIDLRTEKLHIGMQAVPQKGVSPVTLCLGNLAHPFELGGTLAHPRLELDAMKSTVTMGKALGGIAVFGPFGILAALAGSDSDDGNPCVKALERARAQAEGPGERAQEKGTVGKAVDMVGCATKGFGNALKGIFSKDMN